jgi:hypothetical protein
MAEDSSLYSSFPVAHQENCNLVSNVEDAENEQPVTGFGSRDKKNIPNTETVLGILFQDHDGIFY